MCLSIWSDGDISSSASFSYYYHLSVRFDPFPQLFVSFAYSRVTKWFPYRWRHVSVFHYDRLTNLIIHCQCRHKCACRYVECGNGARARHLRMLHSLTLARFFQDFSTFFRPQVAMAIIGELSVITIITLIGQLSDHNLIDQSRWGKPNWMQIEPTTQGGGRQGRPKLCKWRMTNEH